jgi:hypothetical protein
MEMAEMSELDLILLAYYYSIENIKNVDKNRKTMVYFSFYAVV